jgi:hypothetical protein
MLARWPLALYSIAFAIAAAFAATSLGAWQQTRTIVAGDVVAVGGRAYAVVYPSKGVLAALFVHRTDRNDAPTVSRLRLLENGRAIGTPHADHASVRELGSGRYSDWAVSESNNQLIFSTADNSDPRRNGRTYSIVYPLEPTPLARRLTSIVCLSAAMVFLLRHGADIVRRVRRTLRTGAARNGFVAIAYGFGSIVLVLSLGVWRHAGTIDLREVTAIGGNAHSIVLPEQALDPAIFGRQHDAQDAPRASRLTLFEDGWPLGPAHALHATISAAGGGAYSHWGGPGVRDTVIFSTRDNTNPQTNGREYSIAYPLRPGWAMQFGAAMLTLVATVVLYRSASGRQRPSSLVRSALQSELWRVPVVLAAAYTIAYYGWQMPAIPLLQHDSVDYLTGLPTVPLGYLGFARVVAFATGDLAALPAFQISIWSASVVVFYFTLVRTLHWRAIAGAACVALVLFGTTTKYSMFALTECVFMSTVLLHVAAVLRTLERPTRTALIAVGVTAFAAGFLRPAGYFVPLCTIGLLVVVPELRRRILQFAIGPMLLMFLMAGALGHVTRGEAAQSLLGYSLFPYVVPLFDPDDVAPDLRDDATVVARATAVYRAELSEKRTRAERVHFEMANFNAVSRSAELALRGRGVEPDQINDYFADFAFAALKAQPIGYAALLVDHAVYGWSTLFYPIETRAWLAENYRHYEGEHQGYADVIRPLMAPKYRYEDLLSGTRSLEHDSTAFDVVPNAFASIPRLGEVLGIVSAFIVLAGVAFRRRLRGLAPAAYVAVLMHAAIVLIAASTLVIPRYVDAIAPLAVVLLALLLDRLAQTAQAVRVRAGAGAAFAPGQQPASTRRVVAVNVAILLVLLPLTLLLAEAWLRASRPADAAASMFVADRQLGWDSKPSVETVADVGGGATILFIGDSFTHGTQWAGMTIGALRERGYPYDGYSLGVGGYGTIQAYLKLQRHIDRYRPEWVALLFFAWNDVRDNFGVPAIYYSPETRTRPYYRGDRIELPERVLPQWLTTSELYARLVVGREQAELERRKQALGTAWLRDADARTRAYYTDVDTWAPFYLPERQTERYVAEAWRDTERALVELKHLVDERGSRLLLIGIDNAFTVDADVHRLWAQGIDGFDATLPLARLGEIARRRGIDYVACLPALRELRARVGRKVYNGPEGNLSGHFEPEGERRIAELVSERIVARRAPE